MMCFDKQHMPERTTDGTDYVHRKWHLPFADTHPQPLHCAVLRTTPHLPQAICTFSERPAADASTASHELYALTVLSLFMSDHLHAD
jgi:hypothetical protein